MSQRANVTLDPKTRKLGVAGAELPKVVLRDAEISGVFDLAAANYTQATNNTTAVAVTTPTGKITMFGNLTTAAATTSATFNVTWLNPVVGVPIFQVCGYTGTWATNGNPVVEVQATTDTSATLAIRNINAANALAGTVTIAYSLA
jgi:hypothetical protein